MFTRGSNSLVHDTEIANILRTRQVTIFTYHHYRADVEIPATQKSNLYAPMAISYIDIGSRSINQLRVT